MYEPFSLRMTPTVLLISGAMVPAAAHMFFLKDLHEMLQLQFLQNVFHAYILPQDINLFVQEGNVRLITACKFEL